MSPSPTSRRASGDQAEEAAARYLVGLGWIMLARNVKVGRTELDIVALEPGAGDAFVVVEVRSRSGPGFGAPQESVGAAKVARLYAAAWHLTRAGCLPGGEPLPEGSPRVDLIGLAREDPAADRWRLACHLRGLVLP